MKKKTFFFSTLSNLIFFFCSFDISNYPAIGKLGNSKFFNSSANFETVMVKYRSETKGETNSCTGLGRLASFAVKNNIRVTKSGTIIHTS